MDIRGLNINEINKYLNKDKIELNSISNGMLFTSNHSLPIEKFDFKFFSVKDQDKSCYFNPYFPIIIFHIPTNKSTPLNQLILYKKNKLLSKIEFSPSKDLVEPTNTADGIRSLSKNYFQQGIALPKDFFLINSFIGLSSFASNYNPNFFNSQFIPTNTRGKNRSRFKIYDQLKSTPTIDSDLIFLPWGFKYKSFSAWNYNLEKLTQFLMGRNFKQSLSTIQSIFPSSVIKEIINER